MIMNIFKRRTKQKAENDNIVLSERYGKINFAYQIAMRTNELEIIDHVYPQNITERKTEDEQKALNVLKDKYYISLRKKRKIPFLRAFRCKFNDKIFDILIESNRYILATPCMQTLAEEFSQGCYNGKIIDDRPHNSYLSLIYFIIKEEWESAFFEKKDWTETYRFELIDNKPSKLFVENYSKNIIYEVN